MKLTKVKSSVVNRIYRVSIHKTGKLGFNRDAADFLDLKNQVSASIFTNEEDPTDLNLYTQFHAEEMIEDSFKVSKAGEYYYLNTRNLFDKMEIEYDGNHTISYDIFKKEIEGEEYFVFKRRNQKEEEED